MFRNKWVLNCLFGLALVGMFAGSALADLMVDIRATAVPSGWTLSGDGKTVTVPATATLPDDITMQVWVYPDHGNADVTDAVNMISGSIVGQPGTGVQGGMTTVPAWNAGGGSFNSATNYAGGLLQSVNGDGTYNILGGSPPTYPPDDGSKIVLNKDSGFIAVSAGSPGLMADQFTYHVTAAGVGTAATVNWVMMTGDWAGYNGLWKEDGTQYDDGGVFTTPAGTMFVGGDVSIEGVPEPSTLVLLGMAMFGLVLAWRRKSS